MGTRRQGRVSQQSAGVVCALLCWSWLGAGSWTQAQELPPAATPDELETSEGAEPAPEPSPPGAEPSATPVPLSTPDVSPADLEQAVPAPLDSPDAVESVVPAPEEPTAPATPSGPAVEPPARSAEPTPVPEQPTTAASPAEDTVEPLAPSAEPMPAAEAPTAAEAAVGPESETPASPRRTPPPASVAVAPAQRGAKRVSNAELAKLGFFQDFEELDLEALLNPDVLELTTRIASRREVPVEDAPGTVTVLTAADLRSRGVLTLTEALRGVPGFDVMLDSLGRNRIVARGVPTGGFVALSENVLVLLNGHVLNEAISGGATAVNLDIPIEWVARLEILRGPATALYGSGALAGVINVITEEPGAFRGVRLSSSVGNFGTQQQMLRVSNTVAGIKVTGGLRMASTSGYDAHIPLDAQSLRDGLAPLYVGETGRKALESLYRLAFRKWELQWRVYQGDGDTFAGYAHSIGSQGSLFTKQNLLDVSYRDELRGVGKLSVSLGLTGSERSELFEILPPGFEGVLADGRRFRVDTAVFLSTKLSSGRRYLEAQLDRELTPDHQLTAGVLLEREATGQLEALSNLDLGTRQPRGGLEPLPGAVGNAARRALGLYVQDSWTVSPRVGVTGGARLDWLSDAGTRLSPRAAVVAQLPRDLTLKLMYGSAFRAPTFSETRFSLPGAVANPDLSSVTARTYELALGLKRTNLRAGLSGYVTRVRHLVSAERPNSPFDYPQLTALPGVNVFGVELAGRASLDLHSVFANYTYQRSRAAETGQPSAGLPSAGLPAHLATLGTTLAVSRRQTLTLSWQLRSGRPRAQGDQRRRLAGNGVFSANLNWERIWGALDGALAVENLFGLKYQDPAPALAMPGDYPRPGRSLLLTARYRF